MLDEQSATLATNSFSLSTHEDLQTSGALSFIGHQNSRSLLALPPNAQAPSSTLSSCLGSILSVKLLPSLPHSKVNGLLPTKTNPALSLSPNRTIVLPPVTSNVAVPVCQFEPPFREENLSPELKGPFTPMFHCFFSFRNSTNSARSLQKL